MISIFLFFNFLLNQPSILSLLLKIIFLLLSLKYVRHTFFLTLTAFLIFFYAGIILSCFSLLLFL